MGGFQIELADNPELARTLVTLRRAPDTIQRMVATHLTPMVQREFVQHMRENAMTRQGHRMLADSASTTVTPSNIRLQSGSTTLRGGLSDPKPIEFGGSPKTATFDRRSRKGKMHKVTRNVRAGLPAPRRQGYVFYPSVKSMLPIIASMWAQTIVHTIGNALEGKEE